MPKKRPPPEDSPDDGQAEKSEGFLGLGVEAYLQRLPTQPPIILPTSGFDLTTKRVLPWEVDAIRRSLNDDSLYVHQHIINAFSDEDIDIGELPAIIKNGKPVSKDIDPNDSRGRQLGINFEHTISDGRGVRVKVSYDEGYWAVTGHTIREVKK